MDPASFSTGVLDLLRDFLADEVDPLRDEIARLKAELAGAVDTANRLAATVANQVMEISATRNVAEAASAALLTIAAAPEMPDIDAIVRDAVTGLIPPPGPTADEMRAIAGGVLDERLAALPPAVLDIDRTLEAMRSEVADRLSGFDAAMMVAAEVAAAKAVADLDKPVDGKDVDMDVIEGRLDFAIGKFTEKYEHALASMRVPEDGRSVTIDEVMPALTAMLKDMVAALPPAEPGKDGVGVFGAMVDRDGDLHLTLSNGEIRNVGPVVGDDGVDIDTAAVQVQIREDIERLFAAHPKPKDGLDGLGFEDMEEHLEDDGRTLVRTYRRGDLVRTFRHAIRAMIYRGVFKDGDSYLPGDVVTWDGSSWHCDKATTEKPGIPAGDKAWTLMVKRGRNAKDGGQVKL